MLLRFQIKLFWLVRGKADVCNRARVSLCFRQLNMSSNVGNKVYSYVKPGKCTKQIFSKHEKSSDNSIFFWVSIAVRIVIMLSNLTHHIPRNHNLRSRKKKGSFLKVDQRQVTDPHYLKMNIQKRNYHKRSLSPSLPFFPSSPIAKSRT